MSQKQLKYRTNVAAILRNAKKEILICERFGMPGAWQFPQGGIDAKETPEQALARELWEEIGVDPGDFQVVERRGPYWYLFGEGRTKKGYHWVRLVGLPRRRRRLRHRRDVFLQRS